MRADMTAYLLFLWRKAAPSSSVMGLPVLTILFYEQPVVVPQSRQTLQVPFLTILVL